MGETTFSYRNIVQANKNYNLLATKLFMSLNLIGQASGVHHFLLDQQICIGVCDPVEKGKKGRDMKQQMLFWISRQMHNGVESEMAQDGTALLPLSVHLPNIFPYSLLLEWLERWEETLGNVEMLGVLEMPEHNLDIQSPLKHSTVILI